MTPLIFALTALLFVSTSQASVAESEETYSESYSEALSLPSPNADLFSSDESDTLTDAEADPSTLPEYQEPSRVNRSPAVIAPPVYDPLPAVAQDSQELFE